MSYVGNTPFTAAFLTDTFSGNGSTVAFTMSVAPATTSSVIVAITGVLQDPSTYSVSGTTLTFSAAPPTGTSNISVRYLGIPASGVTTTAYRTQTEFTATAGQTTFSVPSYTVGFIDVYRNGLLLGSSDFTATNGTTVVLTNAASAGDFVETVSFYVSSVLNALPNTGGTLSGNLVVNGELTTSGNTVLGDASTDTLNVGNGGLVKDASGNVGIFTASPTSKLQINYSAPASVPSAGATGHVLAAGSAAYGIAAGALTSGNGYLQVTRWDGTASNYDLLLQPNGGFVGIGTDPSGVAPLTVGRAASNGNIGQICARGLAAGDAGSAGMSVMKYDATTTTSQIFFKFIIGQGSAGSGQINANGANTAAFGSYSDSRLKENIVDLPSQLDNIMALRPVEYDYIESMGGGHQIGFVAQEVQAIYPDLIGEGSDGMLTLTDMNKNDARLIKAIQEMKAIIDTQASTITQLQADVAALKGNS